MSAKTKEAVVRLLPLPHISFRRRVVRDLINCGRIAKQNPTRWLCDDAALILAVFEARHATQKKARKK